MRTIKQMQTFTAAIFATFSICTCVSQQCLASEMSGTVRNGLPPTRLDSFVHEAGEYGELIYGDESYKGPPPYMEFDQSHRINAGIVDQNDRGLTTGHGSMMPDAWGRDEFLGLEKSQSGARGLTSWNQAAVDGTPLRTSSVYDLPGKNLAMPDDIRAMYEQQFPTGSVSTNNYYIIPKQGIEAFDDGTGLVLTDNGPYPKGTILSSDMGP